MPPMGCAVSTYVPSESTVTSILADPRTLADALAGLGHRCSGECPPFAVNVPITIAYLKPRCRASGSVSLVVIDLSQRQEPWWGQYLRMVNE